MSKKMSKWEEAGQELEDFIENVYSISLKNENLKNIKIEKNHIEIGKSGTKYKFDVFYEITIAGVSHKVAIECKNHNKIISEDMIAEFRFKPKILMIFVVLWYLPTGIKKKLKNLGNIMG